MFDLVSMAELTGSAAIVIATLVLLFGRGVTERVLIASGLTAWFVLVLWLGASEVLHYQRGIGIVGLGMAVILPVLALTVLVLGTGEGRARLAAAPLSALVAVQAVRVLGISFVLLHAAGRLPAPFAPVAGWGDILVGALALPVAWIVARQPAQARAVLLPFTLLGMADLVAAVGLGILSSPGPVHVLGEGEGSAIMTSLPWIVIPGFLVPALMTVHGLTLYRLARSAGPRMATAAHA